MSYKHLTGRLIETQRSMIGEPAIRIARSVDGITVTDDGAVRAVEGDGRAVVADLAGRYTDVLGGAAERRLQAAADEFAGEVQLPAELGGSDDGTARQDPSVGKGSTVSESATGRVAPGLASDGGTVAVRRRSESTPGPERPGGAIRGETDPASGTAREERDEADAEPEAAIEGSDAMDAESDAESEGSDVTEVESEPVVTEYTLASALPVDGYADLDLSSVYLMPSEVGEWRSPVNVETAVVEALSEATDLSDDGVAALLESVDRDRLFATLADENGETVSFEASGVTLTFHRSGALAVH